MDPKSRASLAFARSKSRPRAALDTVNPSPRNAEPLASAGASAEPRRDCLKSGEFTWDLLLKGLGLLYFAMMCNLQFAQNKTRRMNYHLSRRPLFGTARSGSLPVAFKAMRKRLGRMESISTRTGPSKARGDVCL